MRQIFEYLLRINWLFGFSDPDDFGHIRPQRQLIRRRYSKICLIGSSFQRARLSVLRRMRVPTIWMTCTMMTIRNTQTQTTSFWLLWWP